jgi:hypothetical protein
MAFAIGCLVLGVVLGLWFEVLVLVPVVLMAAMMVGIHGWTSGIGFIRVILTVVVFTVALELGYLAGVAVSMLAPMLQQRSARPAFRASKRSLAPSVPRPHWW